MKIVLVELWITFSRLSSISTGDGSFLPITKSNACFLRGDCGQHHLTCPPNYRIAIKDASHGFKPYSDTCFHEGPGVDCLSLNTSYCCSEDVHQDCMLSYRDHHLQRVFEACSGYTRCKAPQIRVKDACYSMSRSEPASFSEVKYSCIKDSLSANICNRELVTGTSVSTLFKPNGLNMLYDKNCYCRIESTSPQQIDVQVYALDIRFKRSKSTTCSQLSITKGWETHGTISTPTLPGEGFIHSFSPILNLTTPILTRLMLSKHALPDSVWLHFRSGSGILRVKCGRDNSREQPSCMKDIQPTILTPKDFTPDPKTRPKKYSPVVGIMIAILKILLYEKTPLIGGCIAGVLGVFTLIVGCIVLYKRRHIKKLKSVRLQTNGEKPKKNVSKTNVEQKGLRRIRKTSDVNETEAASDTKNTKEDKRPYVSLPLPPRDIIQKDYVNEFPRRQPILPNDGNIIIVSPSNQSRNPSVRSSCTCSSLQAQTISSRQPDLILDSHAAFQSACNEISAMAMSNCCSHNPHRQIGRQGDFCNLTNHGHHNLCCGHELQLRADRLNSVASQVSIGTQIYGNPLPELPAVPTLPISSKKKSNARRHVLDQNNPLYIVHNTNKTKQTTNNANRIWNWLKKCSPASRKLPYTDETESANTSDSAARSNIEEVDIETSDTSHNIPAVLPLQDEPPTTVQMRPKPPIRPSSIPSITPPKPPPRPPPRPQRSSIRTALRAVTEIYTNVTSLAPRQVPQRVKPRIPRRRTLEMGLPQSQSTPVSLAPQHALELASDDKPDSRTPQSVQTPAIVDITAGDEYESSNYANDYIMPVHASRGYSRRYEEVSFRNDDAGDISYMHTITLGLPTHEEEEEGQQEEDYDRFDRWKAMFWHTFKTVKGKFRL